MRRPDYAVRVLRKLREWRLGSKKFRRVAVRGTEKDSAGIEHVVYRHRDVRGREQISTEVDVRLFRTMLARLSREARVRERRQDWGWFFWLNEYGSLTSWDLHAEHDELYKPAVESRARSTRQYRAILREANKRRAADADDELLRHFERWQRRVRAVLIGMDAAKRVSKYIATGQVKADRKKRRIRALLKAGRIPPL